MTTINQPAANPTTGSPRPTATRISVSVLGVLVSLAALEHGVGELLQGAVDPGSIMIRSWPDSPSFDPLDGEPAMTIVPDLLVSGVLTVLVAIVFAGWVVGFAHRRHGGPVLIGLSLVLLLVGGGIAPPLMGVVLGIAATASGRGRRRPPGVVGRALGRYWALLTLATVGGYLALVPGIPLLQAYAGVDSPELVSLLAAVSFAGLFLTLVAAGGHDRAAAS